MYSSIHPPIYSSIHLSICPSITPSCHLIPSSPIHPFTCPPVSPLAPIHTTQVSVHPSSNLTRTAMLQPIHPSTSASIEPRVAPPSPSVSQSFEGALDPHMTLAALKEPACGPGHPLPAIVPDLFQRQIGFCCRHYGQTNVLATALASLGPPGKCGGHGLGM